MAWSQPAGRSCAVVPERARTKSGDRDDDSALTLAARFLLCGRISPQIGCARQGAATAAANGRASSETEPGAVLLIELPGVDPEQVKLSLGSHAVHLELTVLSSPQHPGIAPGHHELSLQLPDGISPDALDASFSHGVLRVRVSKAQAGPRHVLIASTD